MTITADYSYFAPEIAEAMEEAFERAGVDPAAIGQAHIYSCLRSIKLLFGEWSTYGVREWMVTQVTQTMTAGTTAYDLPAGSLEILGAVVRRSGRDTPMYAMSREQLLEIPDKTVQGRPTRYFLDKKYDKVTINIWQAPENSTDIVVMDVLRKMSNPGAMSNTMQMPQQALEAFHAGLAMKLAQKFSKENYDALRVDYGGPRYPEVLGGKIFHMRAATADNADVSFIIRR